MLLIVFGGRREQFRDFTRPPPRARGRVWEQDYSRRWRISLGPRSSLKGRERERVWDRGLRRRGSKKLGITRHARARSGLGNQSLLFILRVTNGIHKRDRHDYTQLMLTNTQDTIDC